MVLAGGAGRRQGGREEAHERQPQPRAPRCARRLGVVRGYEGRGRPRRAAAHRAEVPRDVPGRADAGGRHRRRGRAKKVPALRVLPGVVRRVRRRVGRDTHISSSGRGLRPPSRRPSGVIAHHTASRVDSRAACSASRSVDRPCCVVWAPRSLCGERATMRTRGGWWFCPLSRPSFFPGQIALICTFSYCVTRLQAQPGLSVIPTKRCFPSFTGAPNQLSENDGVGRVSKMASPISKRFHLNCQVRRGCATFPSAARGRTATDDGAAARIYRGTYQGLVAARARASEVT